MKILFVGNSYTYYNDLPAVFEKLANANGKDVKIASVTKGGRKLCEFLTERDEYSAQLESLIAEETYEFCFLQEQSILPIVDYGMFLDGVMGLMVKLKKVVNSFVLYETWARKEGSKTLAEQGWTPAYMTAELASSYQSAAEAAQVSLGVDVKVSYAGLSFADVRKAAPDVELYYPDMTHPSYYGTALAALTHYKTVFGEFPIHTEVLELPPRIDSLFRSVLM